MRGTHWWEVIITNDQNWTVGPWWRYVIYWVSLDNVNIITLSFKHNLGWFYLHMFCNLIMWIQLHVIHFFTTLLMRPSWRAWWHLIFHQVSICLCAEGTDKVIAFCGNCCELTFPQEIESESCARWSRVRSDRSKKKLHVSWFRRHWNKIETFVLFHNNKDKNI